MGNFAGKWKSVTSKNGILPDGYEYKILQNGDDVVVLGKKDGNVMNVGHGKVYGNKAVITWWNVTKNPNEPASHMIVVKLDESVGKTEVDCVISGQEKSFGNWGRI